MLEVRTRFAPSPTGPWHVGGARTALFNWLLARRHGGKFILRIEDTDKERSKPEFEKDIAESLKWLGLEWDEFYRQSERTEIYKEYIERLLKEGKAYFSEEAEGASQSVIRFKNPTREVGFEDIIRGKVKMSTEELGDFVIAKDPQTPLFHLAVVIDDALMKISHVIRGEDHISNTPRQILIQEALDFERPKYAHLPLILGSDRQKLSKRHGAEGLSEYRNMGYLPEAMMNFLALLGWHPKDDREMLSKEKLIKEFSLERVQKGGAIFDIKKLDWLNGEYIRRKSPRELLALIQDSKIFAQGESASGGKMQSEYLEKIIAVEQPRLVKLSELPEKTDYFFKEPGYPKELLRWKGTEDYELVKKHLKRMAELWPDSDKIMAYAEKEGKGEVLWPFRVALSGCEASPGPFEIAQILGKEETLKRIDKALKLLQ